MSVEMLANVGQALAVVTAVVFGIVQVRQFLRAREREAAFALMRSLQTREMLKGLLVLDDLPADLDRDELENRLGDDFIYVQSLLGTWESLGILVFHGEVDLTLVDDFYSGPIVQSWHKLRGLVEDVRRRTDRETRWEWFQWLAERMIELEEDTPPIPAHEKHRPT
ncbi:MAG: DUF4760 domain-containing protein [Gemmatimonadota bacterium]